MEIIQNSTNVGRANVYAPPVSVPCTVFWDYLITLGEHIQGPWLMLKDFNDIILSSEVSGGLFYPSRAFALANFFNECGLLDLGTVRGRFTWRKNIQNGGHMRKKLDRCMVNSGWRLFFPHGLAEVLNPYGSDHNPILVHCFKSPSIKNNSFHFQAAWTLHPDFRNLVSQTWDSTQGDAIMKLDGVQLFCSSNPIQPGLTRLG
ncbi:uncharacterized protein LOC114396862 [Glycine soja]|uniref:uncharacterized protein LOC114396862 n=1 Tax=Glycine soja TaxID=3848 RepID=UPI001039C5E6|nr:uncharacterized protein LOC114396862 [Glycine soja]